MIRLMVGIDLNNSVTSLDLGESLNGDLSGEKKNAHVKSNGTTEIKLTPHEEIKEFKEESYKDPLKKPLLLDDGRWAVISW